VLPVLSVNVADGEEVWKRVQGKLFSNSKVRDTHDVVASKTMRKVLKSPLKLSV
jgi:hypothetical protein